jgi:RNA-directed DNA polymerase
VDPAQSENLSMRGNSLHGNREIPQSSVADGAADRPEKVNDRPSGMHGWGKSDDCIVPKKPSNKDGRSAEMVEGRRSTEENTMGPAASWTQSQSSVSSGLHRVREVARRDKRARFTALLHHVTVDQLRESFRLLHRDAAPGVDDLMWRQYEVGLEERIRCLHRRVHGGTYRALPSKRAYIPKPDGGQRPLGIAALEDKIVQQAVLTVLNHIYEPDFLGFSYGYRPKRGTHDALDALWMGIMGRKVNWVLDADIRGFFDTIDHGWLLKFIAHRVADPRVLRLIRKWLRAGVSEDGQWSQTEVGTPQGSVLSPLLANVYLHYAFDQWVQQWRTKFATGGVIVVRYADDFIVGFQYRCDAERFLKELRERLQKFGLALHPDKTRLIEFGRFAARDRQRRGDGKPETFDFLGFTHLCGRKRQSKGFTVKRQTIAKRLRAKIRTVKTTLWKKRHLPLPDQGRWLRGVVQGYFNYFAIPGNLSSLATFLRETERHWLRSLRRRSQRHRLSWRRFRGIVGRWLPRPKILHPYPNDRFYATHPK